ncbi:MAG: hypothetical protein JXR37_17195 [Kiritimatiellae bacterium]|nr:hypothetical protein [Kiritimatiellia bacterium]
MNREHQALVPAPAALLAVLAVLAGCGGPDGELAKPQAVYTVRQPERDWLVLAVPGQVDNRVPVGHRPRQSRMPVEWVRPEGDEVQPGEKLLVFDTDIVELWIDQRQTEIDLEELTLETSRLSTEQKLLNLRLTKGDLLARKDVLAKSIEATHVQDEREIEIARLELALAQRALEDARKQLAAIKALRASGTVSRLKLREAMDTYEKAFQSTRLPKIRLEILEEYTGALDRRMLEIELAMLRLDLGDDMHKDGVFREMASLEELQRMREQIRTDRLRRLTQEQAKNEDAVTHNYVEAAARGTLRYAESSRWSEKVEPGAKLGERSVAFVLERKEMIVNINLPEHWRNLVRTWDADSPEHGRASVEIPALGAPALSGRVLSIGTTPERPPDGTAKGFSCAIRLDEKPGLLRVGMRATCRLRVPLPAGALVIPTWLIPNLRHPAVALRDGTRRALDGFVAGHQFVVTAGLAPGDRLLAAEAPPSDGTLRVTGVIEACDYLPVEVPYRRHWHYEITDLVPDGSTVQKGQTVAKLQPRWRSADREVERLEAGEIEAQSQFAIDTITAETQLIKAYIAWRKAKLEEERAKLDHLVARYVSYAPDITRTEVALAKAEIDLQNLEQLTQLRTDPYLRETMSVNQVKDLELRLEQARINHRSAQLSHTAEFRKRDWLAVWEKQEKTKEAEEKTLEQRVAYSIARERHRMAVYRAYDALQNRLHRLQDYELRIASENVPAPKDGRVFYAAWGRRGRPAVGGGVGGRAIFVMPLGTRREFEVEVPVRFHKIFEPGQPVSFVVPALGRDPRQGTVKRISHFMPSESAAEERFIRGSVGEPEKVFRMVVAFDLKQDEINGGPPGITGYIDL